MKLDEAIAHAEEVAEKSEEAARTFGHIDDNNMKDACIECAKEHRQLAEWLRELQARRRIDELDRCIIRTAQYLMQEELDKMRAEIKELQKYIEEVKADADSD